MRIKWLKGGLQIPGIGIIEKGKEMEVSNDVGESLISQGIAKLSKVSKIKNNKGVK